jgi:hypothetical protein
MVLYFVLPRRAITSYVHSGETILYHYIAVVGVVI